MLHIPVKSNEMKTIGYEGSTLEIIYRNGVTIQYYRVPEHVYESFISSKNVNTYFRNNIKDIYRYHKMNE